MVFQPSMEQDVTDGFYSLVESLLDDVFKFASLVPRVAKHKDLPDYHSDIEEVLYIIYAILMYIYSCVQVMYYLAVGLIALTCLQIAELSDLRDEVLSRVSTAVTQATQHRDSFNSYAHLWTDDRQEFLTQFLVYGHVPTQVNINQNIY